MGWGALHTIIMVCWGQRMGEGGDKFCCVVCVCNPPVFGIVVPKFKYISSYVHVLIRRFNKVCLLNVTRTDERNHLFAYSRVILPY